MRTCKAVRAWCRRNRDFGRAGQCCPAIVKHCKEKPLRRSCLGTSGQRLAPEADKQNSAAYLLSDCIVAPPIRPSYPWLRQKTAFSRFGTINPGVLPCSMKNEHNRLLYNKYMKYRAIFTSFTTDGRYLDSIKKLNGVSKKFGNNSAHRKLLTCC